MLPNRIRSQDLVFGQPASNFLNFPSEDGIDSCIGSSHSHTRSNSQVISSQDLFNETQNGIELSANDIPNSVYERYISLKPANKMSNQLEKRPSTHSFASQLSKSLSNVERSPVFFIELKNQFHQLQEVVNKISNEISCVKQSADLAARESDKENQRRISIENVVVQDLEAISLNILKLSSDVSENKNKSDKFQTEAGNHLDALEKTCCNLPEEMSEQVNGLSADIADILKDSGQDLLKLKTFIEDKMKGCFDIMDGKQIDQCHMIMELLKSLQENQIIMTDSMSHMLLKLDKKIDNTQKSFELNFQNIILSIKSLYTDFNSLQQRILCNFIQDSFHSKSRSETENAHELKNFPSNMNRAFRNDKSNPEEYLRQTHNHNLNHVNFENGVTPRKNSYSFDNRNIETNISKPMHLAQNGTFAHILKNQHSNPEEYLRQTHNHSMSHVNFPNTITPRGNSLTLDNRNIETNINKQMHLAQNGLSAHILKNQHSNPEEYLRQTHNHSTSHVNFPNTITPRENSSAPILKNQHNTFGHSTDRKHVPCKPFKRKPAASSAAHIINAKILNMARKHTSPKSLRNIEKFADTHSYVNAYSCRENIPNLTGNTQRYQDQRNEVWETQSSSCFSMSILSNITETNHKAKILDSKAEAYNVSGCNSHVSPSIIDIQQKYRGNTNQDIHGNSSESYKYAPTPSHHEFLQPCPRPQKVEIQQPPRKTAVKDTRMFANVHYPSSKNSTYSSHFNSLPARIPSSVCAINDSARKQSKFAQVLGAPYYTRATAISAIPENSIIVQSQGQIEVSPLVCGKIAPKAPAKYIRKVSSQPKSGKIIDKDETVSKSVKRKRRVKR